MATDKVLIQQYFDDHLRVMQRHSALSRDWNRMRDLERDWIRLRNWSLRLFIILVVVGLVAACDSPEKRCGRWSATVDGREICAADPDCRAQMRRSDYLKLTTGV